jgi:hypothetical protein
MSRAPRSSVPFDVVSACAGVLVVAPVAALAVVAAFIDDGRPRA